MERFWNKVKKTTSCWLWTASTDIGGYGIFKYKGKVWKAHRVAYDLTHGQIKAQILHRCDVRSCVNPQHLFIGTQQDNVDDMISKKRQRLYGAAKINLKIAEEIRNLQGQYTQVEIGKMYGISGQQVGKIFKGTRWKTIL